MNKTYLAVLSVAVLLCASISRATELRQSSDLLADWRFKQGEITNADQPMFDDHDWQTIPIPHNWGWEQAQRGEKYLRGPGWYRRDLVVQPKSGRRYFLRFEAAGTVADVWLNGNFLGQHRGGFGAFCFEITKELSPTGTNVVAARVSNAEEPDVAPLSGDFPVYGGLYRAVHLIETEATCFALTDHASPGVAWLESSVSARQAVLDVTAEISTVVKKDKAYTLVARLVDATGKRIAEAEQQVIVASNVTAPYQLRVVVPHPHLWNGRLDPYLYKAAVELRTTNELVDSVEQNIGLRFYAVDPDKGFFLNGKPYHLHGVDRHQDRPDKGWAISEADQDEDMALIKEIGATVIRCAHDQHSDYFYSLCDRAGILVWAEIPQVDKIGEVPQFEDTSRGQLLDLIRQNINHPAIFCWSLFNEIRPGHPDPHRGLQDLNNIAHGEDPTRPTIAATCVDKLPQMNKIPDLLGWNIYPGWYSEWGKLSELGKVEKYRTTSQHGGFCVSEYGAGANVAQHEQNPKQPKDKGQWHPEEWQNVVEEEVWKQLKAKPYIWGTFVWSMFDFTSYWRKEGGIPGRNTKGLVTYDRQTKKDAFYFYKANWSAEPTLYITSRRFIERTNAVTDVKVYSNSRKVELLVNGKSQGAVKNDGNAVFVWKGVTLVKGENTVSVKASKDGKKLTDQCTWELK